MAGDMMLLMRGLAKLSQAVVETQSSTLRSGAGKFSITFNNFLNLTLTHYPKKQRKKVFRICLGATFNFLVSIHSIKKT